jgi:hypothetical protein
MEKCGAKLKKKVVKVIIRRNIMKLHINLID